MARYNRQDRDKLTQKFRAVAWGKLYWNHHNARSTHRKIFRKADIAIVRLPDSTYEHYTTYKSLKKAIRQHSNDIDTGLPNDILDDYLTGLQADGK